MELCIEEVLSFASPPPCFALIWYPLVWSYPDVASRVPIAHLQISVGDTVTIKVPTTSGRVWRALPPVGLLFSLPHKAQPKAKIFAAHMGVHP